MISNLKYRPEIDGLRAVAVISVILFHANIITGGFLGVDIFFVISGYLISYQIINEIKQNGKFSFSNLYKRRVKRILPVLFVIKLITLILGIIFFNPSNLNDLASSAISSLFFISNLYFWDNSLDYNAQSAIFHPLLHTWSLSVEEQFYILFPLFLVFFHEKRLMLVLISISIVSFICANILSLYYNSLNFYLIITRIWEFVFGFFAAHNHVYQKRTTFLDKVNTNLIHSISILILVLCIFFYDKNLKHPSIFTLLPVLSTYFLINNQSNNSIIYKLLSIKPLIFIGLISYSLYLWHYPIFSFSQHLELIEGNFFKKILIGLTIILLSILSYYFIEKRFRTKKINFKKILLFLIINFILIFIIANITLIKKGFPDRLPKILNNYFVSLETNKKKDCIIQGNCEFNFENNKKVYLIGDSHMQTLANDLIDRIKDQNLSYFVSTRPWCFYFPNFELVHKNSFKQTGCNKEYFSELKNRINTEEDSIIIFAGRLPVYLDGEFFDNEEGGKEGEKFPREFVSKNKDLTLEQSFTFELNKILNKNKVILIYPIPEVGWRVPDKIMSNNIKRLVFGVEYKDVTTSYNVYRKRTSSSFALLDKLEHKNLIRFYPHEIFCNKSRCFTHDNYNIYYNDDDHLSKYGAKLLNDSIINIITNLN